MYREPLMSIPINGHSVGMNVLAPQAVAELRRLGADHLADHTEIHAAGPLLTGGRFEEVDALVTGLAGRYRAHGPPTFLNWTLVTLGYSALFQARTTRPNSTSTRRPASTFPTEPCR